MLVKYKIDYIIPFEDFNYYKLQDTIKNIPQTISHLNQSSCVVKNIMILIKVIYSQVKLLLKSHKPFLMVKNLKVIGLKLNI